MVGKRNPYVHKSNKEFIYCAQAQDTTQSQMKLTTKWFERKIPDRYIYLKLHHV